MVAKGHVCTPHNYPQGWFLGLIILQLFKAPKIPMESPSYWQWANKATKVTIVSLHDKQCPLLCTQLMAAPKDHTVSLKTEQ